MRRRITCLVAAGLLAAACTNTDLTRPGRGLGPAYTISDAAHSGGKPHFYFLSPIITPAPVTTGTFDSTLAPEVQVCVVSGADCAPTVADFTTTTSWG